MGVSENSVNHGYFMENHGYLTENHGYLIYPDIWVCLKMVYILIIYCIPQMATCHRAGKMMIDQRISEYHIFGQTHSQL